MQNSSGYINDDIFSALGDFLIKIRKHSWLADSHLESKLEKPISRSMEIAKQMGLKWKSILSSEKEMPNMFKAAYKEEYP